MISVNFCPNDKTHKHTLSDDLLLFYTFTLQWKKCVIEITHQLPLVAVALPEARKGKTYSNRNKGLKAKINSLPAKF